MNSPLLPRPRFWAEAAAQKRNTLSLLGETLMFFLVFLAASILQGVLVSIPTLFWFFKEHGEVVTELAASGTLDMTVLTDLLYTSMPGWLTAVLLLSQVTMAAAAMFYCTKFERRKIATMGLTGPAPAREYLLGFGIGLALFAAVIGVGTLVDGYQVGPGGIEPGQVPILLLLLIGYLVQGFAEEVFVRGYFAVSLSKRYPVPLAVLLSSLVFALLHGGNTGVGALALVNTLLIGVVLCVYTLKRGSLWGACAIHAAWNIAQGPVFGLRVSGLEGGGGLLTTEVNAYNRLLSGGEYGPEGSICVTVVLIAALGAVLALKARDPAPPKPTEG